MKRRRIIVRLVHTSPAELLAAARLIVRHAAEFGGTHRGGLVRWALAVLARAKRWKVAA